MYVCMYVCVCIYIYMYTYTHTFAGVIALDYSIVLCVYDVCVFIIEQMTSQNEKQQTQHVLFCSCVVTVLLVSCSLQWTILIYVYVYTIYIYIYT